MVKGGKREQARALRQKGMSYSAIRDKLGINKSTLSYWLSDMPLSAERINELRAHSPRRIERFRNTMQRKRQKREEETYGMVSQRIGSLTQRELFIAGFFLYWAEGGKTQSYNITLSNTDPTMLKCYLAWIQLLGVPLKNVRVRLHLYKDMNVQKEIKFWSKQLKIPVRQFRQSYIKASALSGLSRKGFGHGTCNICVDGREISEYVLQGLKYLSSKF